MKRLQKTIISFGIVAVLAAGSSSVFAKSETSKERNISGSIVRIDRGARTITVREQGTNQEIQVKVPAGSVLRTNQVGLPATGFEQLLVGMFIRDVRVQ
jgi:predicted lipoprotein